MRLGPYGKLVNAIRTYAVNEVPFSTEYFLLDANGDKIRRHTFQALGLHMIPGTQLLVERCDTVMIILTLTAMNLPHLTAHITITPQSWTMSNSLHVTVREFEHTRFKIKPGRRNAGKDEYISSTDVDVDLTGKRSPALQPGLLRLNGWKMIQDKTTRSFFQVMPKSIADKSGKDPVKRCLSKLLLQEFGSWVYGPFAVLTHSPPQGWPQARYLPVDTRRTSAYVRVL